MSSPRPVLKSKAASMSLLSFQRDPIPAASEAIDNTLRALLATVKAFKCPTELDFSGCPENPLLLANNETNKPFLNQLRKLGQLRKELAEIQTYGDVLLESKHSAATRLLDAKDEMNLVQNVKNRQFIDQLHQLDSLREDLNAISMQGNEQLEKEHKKASMAIGQYLQKMKQHQRTLYDNYVKSYKPRNYIEELAPSPTAEDFEVPVLEKCISARRNKDGTYMSMEFAGFEQVN
ncbi:hypothetical protein B0J17DRAFT_632011 [Rhizoctonia solani]|nr:hypothetical protein B0J17DRAFT_632011 [Rhizoctonia solani]